MEMLWLSKKALLTTDPDAPESIISVIGMPFILAAQHKAVKHGVDCKFALLTSISNSLVRHRPLDNSALALGEIASSCAKVMLHCVFLRSWMIEYGCTALATAACGLGVVWPIR